MTHGLGSRIVAGVLLSAGGVGVAGLATIAVASGCYTNQPVLCSAAWVDPSPQCQDTLVVDNWVSQATYAPTGLATFTVYECEIRIIPNIVDESTDPPTCRYLSETQVPLQYSSASGSNCP